LIVVLDGPGNELDIQKHFATCLSDGHSVLSINHDNIKQGVTDIADKLKPKEDIYTFGLDFGNNYAFLTYCLYNSYTITNKIWSIPCLEEPDIARYVFKQKNIPTVNYTYNCEPFVSFTWTAVDIYYNAIHNVKDFNIGDVLISKYGDYWKVSTSEYEKQRQRAIRDLLCSSKVKKVLDIGCYLGYLDDLLEMNGIDVIRTDISIEAINHNPKVLDYKKLTQDDLKELCSQVDCVLLASVLYAYKEDDSLIEKLFKAILEVKPKFILYEDAVVNFSSGDNPWIELFSRMGYNVKEKRAVDSCVEEFFDNKNIIRIGSVSNLLEHYVANEESK
jgi:hypothetical protein